MQPIIEQRLPQIKRLCRRFHVRRLELFGSAARDDFNAQRSDFDFLVEFDRAKGLSALGAYFGLKEALERLLEREVDLVMFKAVENPYLKASIEENRETVYAA